MYFELQSFVNVPFANIFSRSVACLLNFLTLSFLKKKALILMKSRVSIISSILPLVLYLKSPPY